MYTIKTPNKKPKVQERHERIGASLNLSSEFLRKAYKTNQINTDWGGMCTRWDVRPPRLSKKQNATLAQMINY